MINGRHTNFSICFQNLGVGCLRSTTCNYLESGVLFHQKYAMRSK